MPAHAKGLKVQVGTSVRIVILPCKAIDAEQAGRNRAAQVAWLDGAIFVSMMATTIDEEEPQLLSQEITSERVPSIDDALAVIKKGMTRSLGS